MLHQPADLAQDHPQEVRSIDLCELAGLRYRDHALGDDGLDHQPGHGAALGPGQFAAGGRSVALEESPVAFLVGRFGPAVNVVVAALTTPAARNKTPKKIVLFIIILTLL